MQANMEERLFLCLFREYRNKIKKAVPKKNNSKEKIPIKTIRSLIG